MRQSISFGQYYSGASFIYELDPRVKILLTFAYAIVVYMTNSIFGLLLTASYVIALSIISHIPIRVILGSLKFVIPIMIITALLKLFSTEGEILYSFWKFRIIKEGISEALYFTIRLSLLIIGVSFLTFTTSSLVLADAIEKLMSPLKKIKVPVHDISMMMIIAIRFIPELMEETERIIDAQKSRGSDFDSGNLFKRIMAFFPVLFPLLISSLKHADELALAMECRGYNHGENYTSLHEFHIRRKDIISLITGSILILLILII